MNAGPQPGERLYDPAYYDAGYYGGGARGGFRSYKYGSFEQAQQLQIKWDSCRSVPHRSALFVGCALGFEVAFWRSRLRDASGVDVSEFAIANQIPEAGGKCHLYGGRHLNEPDSSVDLVACFDVLPHLPDDMRADLIAEIVRVAGAGVVWRQIVKDWTNLETAIDGQDGAWFHYWTFEALDKAFTQSGKLRLESASRSRHHEVTAVYVRA